MRIGMLYFVVCLLFMQPKTTKSQEYQEKKYAPRLEYSAYAGALVIHREAMEGLGNHPYLGQELRLGFQTTGSDYWHRLYKYPVFGAGVYSGYFNNPAIGNPLAVFGFIEIPFYRGKTSLFSTSWASGVAFHINEYNSLTNPENIAIGTDINVYIDFSLLYRHQFSERLSFGGGLKFQHFSNGAIQHPNLGLNMVSGLITFNYALKPDKLQFLNPEPEASDKKYEWNFMYALGVNGKNQDEPNVRYINHTFSMGVNQRVSEKRTLGLGVDVFHNEELKEDVTPGETVKPANLLSYAAYASSDLIIHKFRIAVQLGFYLHRPADYSLPFYERVAFRYYLTPNLFTNVSIKAHAAKAQYFEWGIGVSF
ncbi:MAG: acyloxyacyl hydrolase [Salinivirgaceae bacterium]